MEAKAAQPPSVFNMDISASKDGISAGCEFSGYRDQNEYIIQLYLNRVEDDGSVQEIVYTELAAAADGRGTGRTAWEHVETGIYKATAAVKRYEGVNLAETVFADSVLYQVVKDGDSYSVMPYQKEPENVGKSDREFLTEHFEKALSEGEENREYPACDHDKVFDLVQEADTGKDALMEERCGKCGEVFSYFYVPNSAYAAFLKESAQAVLNAKEEEILIVTDRWMSFNQEVLDVISAHPEVIVTIHYKYCGKQYAVTIPAGTDAAALADENGYCGFLYLYQLYA